MSCAGLMNKQITIESNTPSQNSCGELIDSWSTLATVWGERLKPNVAERYTGHQVTATRGIVWRVRYRSDITELMRVVYSSVNYDIKGVYEEGRNYLIILTEAIL